jgi:hypothetical protein
MPDDNTTQRTLEIFLGRAVADGTKTLADIKALSLSAFAKVNEGTTVVEVAIEGGTTRAVVNCPPSIVLAACETVIAQNDPGNTLAGASPEHRYADFSWGRIET